MAFSNSDSTSLVATLCGLFGCCTLVFHYFSSTKQFFLFLFFFSIIHFHSFSYLPQPNTMVMKSACSYFTISLQPNNFHSFSSFFLSYSFPLFSLPSSTRDSGNEVCFYFSSSSWFPSSQQWSSKR